MKLEKGTKVKIVKYGHRVPGKDGKPVDRMPQYVGQTGVIAQAGPFGYMIKLEKEKQTIGWFEEEQTEEI